MDLIKEQFLKLPQYTFKFLQTIKHYYFLLISLLVLTLFLWVNHQTAWLGDDMFISMRQIWNVIHGEGFTYNYDQRVQAFTHPSWVLLLSGITFFTKELFITNLVVSVTLSVLAIGVLLAFNRNLNDNKLKAFASLLVITSLTFSQAFTDYMTSGLENPLSYLLIGCLVYITYKQPILQGKHLTLIFVLLALAFLNRFDYALLLLPITVYITFIKSSFLKSLKYAITGIILIISWFVFSTIYFGAPFPNTFYAKLGASYPTSEYITRGLHYFTLSYERDPITILLMLSGVLAGLFTKSGVSRSLAIGMVLYALYVLKSGGGFMQGRFFAILAYVGVINILIMIQTYKDQVSSIVLSSALIAFFLTFFTSPLQNRSDFNNREFKNGIADERGYYYQNLGFNAPNHKWPIVVKQTQTQPKTYAPVCGGLGMKGLNNSEIYLIDQCALSDAFIARLPAIQKPNWRIGHHIRKVPTNYGEFLLNGSPLVDTQLQPLLDDVTLVVSGDIFTMERFKAIYRLNVSKPYNFDQTPYINHRKHIAVSNMYSKYNYKDLPNEQVLNGTAWNAPGHIIIHKGLDITVEEPKEYQLLSMSFDHNDDYRVIINNKTSHVIKKKKARGVVGHTINVSTYGVIESIRIIPFNGDRKFSLGHIILVD